ncbi:hypothetical protein FGO68_gene12350 [Halteria grandinella]|uniref:Uncharacterized protein n=1 Tax=Halteria grandinella TaxID=5974 RepID=A0A8J8NVG7_HALGN|nr:hypothetical protein FGO68_gene12350 [Halteria grandinella]
MITNTAQFLNAWDKGYSNFVIRNVSASLLSEASQSSHLHVKDYEIYGSDPGTTLQTLITSKNISINILRLKDIVIDKTFIKERLPMIKKGLLDLETLELNVDFSRFFPEAELRDSIGKKVPQMNIYRIQKLKIVLVEGYNYNMDYIKTCIELILTYIKPNSELVIVSDRFNTIQTFKTVPKSTYIILLLKILKLINPRVTIMLESRPVIDQTMLVGVREMNSTIGQRRFKIKGAFEYSKDIDKRVIAKSHYAIYTGDKNIFMTDKEARLNIYPHLNTKIRKSQMGSGDTPCNCSTAIFCNEVQKQRIQEGEDGTALDMFLSKSTNLQSFYISMITKTIIPLQAKLQKDQPFPSSLNTLIFENPCGKNASLYIDIINKSRGQISKLILRIRDHFFNICLLLEKVDPAPLKELDISFEDSKEFNNEHFYDCIDVICKNLEILTIYHIEHNYHQMFRDRMDKILPKLDNLRTFKFKAFYSYSYAGKEMMLDTAVPPCLLLGQPPHLTSLVLLCDSIIIDVERLQELLKEINQNRTSKLAVKLQDTDNQVFYNMQIAKFKEMQKLYPMIELDVRISL